ncbi:DUF2188 domain-containing protein [Spirillospora sp. NPDC047279]|uniref:DUF2188 domain-containing protein n=1 Tax=Spirillospora sp. NPDC047279 TaxID=3155478 RepID=UPI003402BD80
MGDRHVLPHARGWQIAKSDKAQASEVHETQEEAIGRAREIIHNDGGGELVIHGEDGKIRDKRTIAPATDPYPPRG